MRMEAGLEDPGVVVSIQDHTILFSVTFHFSSTANGTCLFRNNEPNVVSFYNDLEIREDVVEFPPGATIISR